MVSTRATSNGHASKFGFTTLMWLNRIITAQNQDNEIQLKKYNVGIFLR